MIFLCAAQWKGHWEYFHSDLHRLKSAGSHSGSYQERKIINIRMIRRLSMENIKNIDGIHLYLCEDKQQMYRILDDIQSNSRNVLAIYPDPDAQDHFLGYMLMK